MQLFETMMLSTILLVSVSLLQFVPCYSEAIENVVEEKVNLKSQIETINQQVEKWYQSEFDLMRKIKGAMGFPSYAQRQSEEKHWPRGMMKILQVATGVPTADAIDMAEVRRIIGGLQLNYIEEEMELNNNIWKYFTKKLSFNDKLADMMDSYRLHESMCAPFRQHGDDDFNFSSAIKDLIRMKRENYIDDYSFIVQVVNTQDAISPLYSATLICRRLDEQRGIHIPGDHAKIVKYWPYAIE